MDGERLLLGVIGRPHGVRGLVRVQSFTADPCAIADYGPLEDGSGKRCFRLRVVGRGAMPVCAVDGIDNRDAAARLTGTRLYVARSRLPAVDDPDEFYYADLIGLAAEDPCGQPIGRVIAVHDHGAGAFLEIAPPAAGRESLLVPFSRASVPLVDLARRRLVVVQRGEVVVPPAAAPRAGAAA